ncbi:hypothetical protein ABZS66_02960 [Dactylosporangium sp. NPDC005572]|uniref:hypothetical protein n=1 Tax=Dactylosporangium sp. NPDC005572 TaxID=3156889 RepID=UPI00339EA026
MTGWAGLFLALLGAYPSLFPWSTAADRGIGVMLCLLLAGLAARMSVLALQARLDWALSAIIVALVLVLAVVAAVNNAQQTGPGERPTAPASTPTPTS